MSLILEALKKSEAERRGVDSSAGAPRARDRGRTRGALMAAIALAGAAAGWWGSRQWTRPDAPAIAVRPEAPGAVDPEPPVGAIEAESTAAEPEPDAKPPGAMVAAPSAVAPGAVADDSAAPVPPVANEAAPASRAATTAGEPTARVVPAGTAPVATAVTPAPEPAPATGLPRFNQLPGLRSEVGSLVLNMLVYSTRAESRFALINLKRVVEGDQLAPGLTVKEIRRDGVVLSHRGEAVLLTSG